MPTTSDERAMSIVSTLMNGRIERAVADLWRTLASNELLPDLVGVALSKDGDGVKFEVKISEAEGVAEFHVKL
jgi:hypothetical protein